MAEFSRETHPDIIRLVEHIYRKENGEQIFNTLVQAIEKSADIPPKERSFEQLTKTMLFLAVKEKGKQR